MNSICDMFVSTVTYTTRAPYIYIYSVQLDSKVAQDTGFFKKTYVHMYCDYICMNIINLHMNEVEVRQFQDLVTAIDTELQYLSVWMIPSPQNLDF